MNKNLATRALLAAAVLIAFGGSLFSGFHFDDYSIFDERTWHYGDQKNVKDLQKPPAQPGQSGLSEHSKNGNQDLTQTGSTPGFKNAIFPT